MSSSENNKCHDCGKEATRLAKDPWKEEWEPTSDNPEVWWCEKCYLGALRAI